ncbi:MAG TPA: AraC family transcriptional regulator [Pararhizobium sp.]|uniref:AraC family transcriptional regulator n=1 Tax=Pararhizobium sp. TaxID=1977563 RepID=UPI002BD793F4|nr:AraC family transcriptional regulator [Pararhizobium sp.]HTO31173.1 AraC family transcriptional regulator [Pararhizobium sp.]
MKTGQFRMRLCVLAGVEAVEADSAHSFGRHTHDQFGIGIIIRGAQKSASGRGPVEAGPGDVITVNPGEVHDGCPIDEAGRAWRMLYLDPALIGRASLDISDGQSADFVFCDPVMTDAAMAHRLQSVYSAMLAPEGGETLLAETELLDLVASLLGARASRAVPSSISRAKSLIDDDPTSDVTLTDLAEASGLSRFQMLRGFTRATGMTPHAYLIQCRIGIVRRMIARGIPLAEASTAGGFADQSHMTRHFVRAHGVTPGAYALAFG